jgi:hypothetical protein
VAGQRGSGSVSDLASDLVYWMFDGVAYLGALLLGRRGACVDLKLHPIIMGMGNPAGKVSLVYTCLFPAKIKDSPATTLINS